LTPAASPCGAQYRITVARPRPRASSCPAEQRAEFPFAALSARPAAAVAHSVESLSKTFPKFGELFCKIDDAQLKSKEKSK
jgi:hypothetical protein